MWSTDARRLAILLLAVVVPPAATLVWLGLRLLEQDGQLALQREQERRETAARTIALSLEQSLSTVEHWADEAPLPDGIIRFVISPAGITASPAGRLLWLPAPPADPAADSDLFAEAERWEYQGEPARALGAYLGLVRSRDRTVKAGALLRVARVHRRERRWDAALNAYRALAEIHNVSISSMPGDLLARRAVCAVLAESGRIELLRGEATTLEQEVLAGGFLLDRAAWDLTVRDLERWLSRPIKVTAERQLFSSVSERLWEAFRSDPVRAFHGARRRLVGIEPTPVTVLVRTSGEVIDVLAISPALLHLWLKRALGAVSPGAGGRIALVGPSGELVAGGEAPNARAAVRLAASETGLPWTLAVDPLPAAAADEAFATRQRAARDRPRGRPAAARRWQLLPLAGRSAGACRGSPGDRVRLRRIP